VKAGNLDALGHSPRDGRAGDRRWIDRQPRLEVHHGEHQVVQGQPLDVVGVVHAVGEQLDVMPQPGWPTAEWCVEKVDLASCQHRHRPILAPSTRV
jgi:hypothetical protein